MLTNQMCRDMILSRLFSLFAKSLLAITAVFCVLGCSRIYWPVPQEECKFRTYANVGVLEFTKARFQPGQGVRLAVIPFDVPATFTRSWDETGTWGRDLAVLFQGEFFRSGEFGIVELFDRDRWPGKRFDFASGNYQAIEAARNAGYDLVLIGQLEELRDDYRLMFHTRLIDTAEGITLWDGITELRSHRRGDREALARLRLVKDRPELFYFNERAEKAASCTVREIIKGQLMP